MINSAVPHGAAAAAVSVRATASDPTDPRASGAFARALSASATPLGACP